MDQHAPVHPDHRLERLMFFSDAVFAIAITLIALEIHLPAEQLPTSAHAWLVALVGTLPQLAAFGLSFAVIGAFWASHHTLMAMLRGFDQRLVWPNLLFLLFIVLIPFATRLTASGSLLPAPFVVYSGLLAAAGLAKAYLVDIALNDRLVDPAIDIALVARERRRRWIMPVVASAALALAFGWPAWNNLAMLALPLAKRLPPWR